MVGCLGNVLRGSHVTEPAPKDHVVSPDAYTELRSVMAGKPGSCIRKKNPGHYVTGVLFFRSLAMTYSHMGKPHTTIGDAPFHC